MKSLARGCTVLTATALLAACAAQRDSERKVEQNAAAPPELGGNTSIPHDASQRAIEAPETSAEVQEAANEPTRQRRQELAKEYDLSEIVVTGSRTSRSQQQAVMAVAVAPASPMLMNAAGAAMCCIAPYQQPTNTEQYQHLDENPVHRVAEQPVSTFSIDVDTGAYANVRRFLNGGQLPPQDAVRVEEMINYFDYQYTPPATRETPFRVATELTPAPWNSEALLLKIGIKG